MLKDITFGQYFSANSFIHKLDPRAKILLLILFIVLIFSAGNFAGLGAAAFLVVIAMLFSGIPARMYLKNLKVVIPIVIFTALLNIFYGDPETLLLFSFWKINIYLGGIFRAIFMTVRVILLILISSTLTYTTTPNDLTDAIERLLKPLKIIGLGSAVHTMSMMMTIALRFIPTLIEETNKILNAQKARGADIESGGLVKKVKALLPILIPLLISSVRRAYELAEAMECRCYNGGKGRKRMKTLHLSYRDFLAFFILLAFIAGVIVSNFFITFGVI
jgi:energy-coupling factor transport system permease protein